VCLDFSVLIAMIQPRHHRTSQEYSSSPPAVVAMTQPPLRDTSMHHCTPYCCASSSWRGRVRCEGEREGIHSDCARGGEESGQQLRGGDLAPHMAAPATKPLVSPSRATRGGRKGNSDQAQLEGWGTTSTGEKGSWSGWRG
jgi:hypothetical protein